MKMTDFIFNSWGGGGGSTWSITEKGLYSTGANAADLVFIKNEKSKSLLVMVKHLCNTKYGKSVYISCFKWSQPSIV